MAGRPRGLSPGNNESAGKHKSVRNPKGSRWLRTALDEAAKAASRTKDTYLSAQYARLRGRGGHARATVAVAHSKLVAAFHILDRGIPHQDLGSDYFTRRLYPAKIAARYIRQLNALGYRVTLEPGEAA